MRFEYAFTPLKPLKVLLEGETYERLKRSLLTVMIRQKDLVFKSQTDPDGRPWKALSKTTLAVRKWKTKKGRKVNAQILQDTGTLRNSVSAAGMGAIATTEGDEIVLGTNVSYAMLMQEGGAVTRSTSPFGAKLKEPKTYIIPARPFMGIGEADNERIIEKIEAFVDKEGGFQK